MQTSALPIAMNLQTVLLDSLVGIREKFYQVDSAVDL